MSKKQASTRNQEGETIPHAQRNRRAWVVVSYDIPDDKRRTRVMNLLYGYGVRVQYSVFECEVRPGDLEELKLRMRRLILKELDDVRFYSLCQSCLEKVTVMGKAKLHRRESYVLVD
ncbi:MAG: CRISPR-associated endonuclease Cas2 [Caldilinea sp.]|jgi:CRISPR-associated protein Cas2